MALLPIRQTKNPISGDTLEIFKSGVTGLVVVHGVRYAWGMRYPDGGGLTAQERARREQVWLRRRRESQSQ